MGVLVMDARRDKTGERGKERGRGLGHIWRCLFAPAFPIKSDCSKLRPSDHAPLTNRANSRSDWQAMPDVFFFLKKKRSVQCF